MHRVGFHRFRRIKRQDQIDQRGHALKGGWYTGEENMAQFDNGRCKLQRNVCDYALHAQNV
jgi:hypothetical protein